MQLRVFEAEIMLLRKEIEQAELVPCETGEQERRKKKVAADLAKNALN